MAKFDKVEKLNDATICVENIILTGVPVPAGTNPADVPVIPPVGGGSISDKEIGSLFIGAEGFTESDGLLPLADRYTITGGALTFPKFAARIPALVSGDDIVVPIDFNGAAIRNLGGLAAGFMVPQSDATAVNGLSGIVTGPANQIRTNVNSGTGNTLRSLTNRTVNLSSTDTETRMKNFGMQFYLKLDNY